MVDDTAAKQPTWQEELELAREDANIYGPFISYYEHVAVRATRMIALYVR